MLKSLHQCIVAGDFESQLALLRQFKAEGGTDDEAMLILEELRASVQTEQLEDRVLDLMDIVIGQCAPTLRVWL